MSDLDIEPGTRAETLVGAAPAVVKSFGALRLRLHNTSYEDNPKELQLTMLEERRDWLGLKKTHKILHGVLRVEKECGFSYGKPQRDRQPIPRT